MYTAKATDNSFPRILDLVAYMDAFDGVRGMEPIPSYQPLVHHMLEGTCTILYVLNYLDIIRVSPPFCKPRIVLTWPILYHPTIPDSRSRVNNNKK